MSQKPAPTATATAEETPAAAPSQPRTYAPAPHPVPDTAPPAARQLVAKHRDALEAAIEAAATRGWHSRYPESPSPRVYGESAADDGRQAFEAHLTRHFSELEDQPATDGWVGDEVSPYGPTLRVEYPHQDVDRLLDAAAAAVPSWRDAGPEVRAAVCLEAVDRIHDRSFEIANAVMHTTGQPFVMAFQAAGPHAQDRALEAIAYALFEQRRVPASVLWEKPGRGEPLRMVKEYRVVPRGVALVIGCNTFPTWNGYPGLFASLATGNAVVVKPHPRAVLPLAISVAAIREALQSAGFDPDLVTLAAEADGEGLAKTLALDPRVAIIDYTGGPGFGQWLEQEAGRLGKAVYTEKAGVNTIVLDSTDDVSGTLGNLAFSFTLYSGQMCTTPQNVYVPRGGIETDQGHLSFDEVAQQVAGAVQRLTSDDAKAVELLGATVNPAVRERAASLATFASSGGGQVVLDSRTVEHPAYPDAVVRTPGLVTVDASARDTYTQECFGPVAILVATDSTDESLQLFRDTVREHGAMTAAVYSSSEDVLERARQAAMDAGVALSENLTGGVFVNQTAAFSDFHGTGANPAANAAYTDGAFVASRFRIITTRRHA
ncbi:MAG TPA: phenylacetic acid degradation protein PaaN [Actinomycetales bacterium]|nr:phenylacetic acid degradation protein PaaN [Actinomycetales bacterium]